MGAINQGLLPGAPSIIQRYLQSHPRLSPSSINAMTIMTTIIIHILIWVHCDHCKGHNIVQDVVPTEGCHHQVVTKVVINDNQSTISPFVIDDNNSCSP